jgi:hypothetical protein
MQKLHGSSNSADLKLTAIFLCCVSERPAVGAFISDTSMFRMRRPSR